MSLPAGAEYFSCSQQYHMPAWHCMHDLLLSLGEGQEHAAGGQGLLELWPQALSNVSAEVTSQS